MRRISLIASLQPKPCTYLRSQGRREGLGPLARGISLSAAVAGFFPRLPDDSAPQVGPWTRRLIGAAGAAQSDAELPEEYRGYPEQKYR
jgi:hypothetical protein